jgi:ABC-type glycerol-3-phosphate transport system permease component
MNYIALIDRKLISLAVAAMVAAGFFLLARSGKTGYKIVVYIILISAAITMLFPFYSMMVMATHANRDVLSPPPPLWFGSSLKQNLIIMNDLVKVPRAFFNSLIISGSHTVLTLLFCSMGGYAFAMHRFRGRKFLFAVLLATMMVPGEATLIPWYIMMSRIGWIDTMWALIIPGCAGAFGIFFMRQYCYNNVPLELLDAARIDGCPEWQIFFRVAAPVLKPAYATLGIMTFTSQWNDYLGPYLMLKNIRLETVPLMLARLAGNNRVGFQLATMQAASMCVVIPVIIVYLFASKYFISGLTAGAIKG